MQYLFPKGAAFFEAYFVLQSLFGSKVRLCLTRSTVRLSLNYILKGVLCLRIPSTYVGRGSSDDCNNQRFDVLLPFVRGGLQVSLCAAPSRTVPLMYLVSRWHWRSFLAGGGSAFWLVLYGLIFWGTRLNLDGVANKVLFLGYLFLISVVTFIVLGSIGFVSCYAFLRVI